jgi:predicted AlkP superfamily pyrophosphatase or phosphodiesterase
MVPSEPKSMRPLLVIDCVGLSKAQVTKNTPHLWALAQRGVSAPLSAVLPAVTCSAQATFLTGKTPSKHGAVGNGWRLPSTGEVGLWRQANSLVEGEKIYETARQRNPDFTCAKLFWWWNLGAAVDWSITPRPFYPADGRKIPATYAWPTGFGQDLEGDLGAFPFFDFWGPKAGLPSSRWIAQAAIRTLELQRPTLTLVYLPHLDYDHQRFGPGDPRSVAALGELDKLVGELVAAADARGAETLVLSEYAISPVSRTVHINRALREGGLLAARPGPAGETLDVYGSRAFALADHQVAHVYCQDDGARAAARAVLQGLPGVDQLLEGAALEAAGLAHPNAGDLVAVSDEDSWFSYYYWLDPSQEPDFAHTIDIHRKPGYDPLEMFIDPDLAVPLLRVARRLTQKKLGMRYLMDVIPVDKDLVRGSHGRLPQEPEQGPVWISSAGWDAGNPEPEGGVVSATDVRDRMLGLMGLS